MPQALVIRGHYANGTFIPAEPLPATEGDAELIVIPTQTARPAGSPASIFDLFGKAPRLRSAEDIAAQVREDARRLGRTMIYADTNVIIRLMEGDATTRTPIEARLLPLRGSGRFLGTSRLSRLECRVKPLRHGDTALLALYDAFFTSAEVALLDVTEPVLEKATDLRAHLNVKTPDAIHLASAILSGAIAFLTGDRNLARCADVPVEIL